MIPEARTWYVSGRWFGFADQRIFYRDEGAGEALLCIHGFPTSSWDWQRIWPGLVRRFRVIAPDMLGFGFSDKPAHHQYSIGEQTDLHEQLLSHLGITGVHILAHDYGDTVVQEWLARPVRRVAIRSALLLNGGLFPEAIHPRPIQRLLLSPLGRVASSLLTEARFRKSFAAVFARDSRPTPEELHTFWEIIKYNRGHHLAHRVIRYMRERWRHRERWVAALQESRVPLRFAVGDQDPVSGAAMAARYRELMPSPDILIFNGVGHYPQWEAPEKVLQALEEFMPQTAAG